MYFLLDWKDVLFFVGNDLVIVLLTLLAVRIFFGRPIRMQQLTDLTNAIQALATSVANLANAGVVPASALPPLTASVNAIKAQVDGLVPAPPAPAV